MTVEYDEKFYQRQQDGSTRSARIVVPMLINLVGPKSVIDIGCGVGTWLSVFHENGVDVLGIDGNSMGQEMLKIDKKNFISANLEERIHLDKRFDLAISLEVMEHLSKERTHSFVEDLTKLSDVILFSCAVPGQGGFNHINEQWITEIIPLFENHGYHPFDCIRPFVWNNENVEVWYRQNIVIFGNKKTLTRYPNLLPHSNEHRVIWDVIHPQLYGAKVKRLNRIQEKKHVKFLRFIKELKLKITGGKR